MDLGENQHVEVASARTGHAEFSDMTYELCFVKFTLFVDLYISPLRVGECSRKTLFCS